MTSEQVLGTIIFLVAAVIITFVFRMWRNHIIKQEHERFAEKESGSTEENQTQSE